MTRFPFVYRKALMPTEKILVVNNKRNAYCLANVKHKLLRIRILPNCRVYRVLQKYSEILLRPRAQGQVRKIKNENRQLSLVPATISQCGSKANKKNLLWYNNLCNFMIHNLKNNLYIKLKLRSSVGPSSFEPREAKKVESVVFVLPRQQQVYMAAGYLGKLLTEGRRAS